jgi:hypothetical protein
VQWIKGQTDPALMGLRCREKSKVTTHISIDVLLSVLSVSTRRVARTLLIQRLHTALRVSVALNIFDVSNVNSTDKSHPMKCFLPIKASQSWLVQRTDSFFRHLRIGFCVSRTSVAMGFCLYH